MDIMHVEARYPEQFTLPKDFIEKLPSEVTVFTTVQFLDSLDAAAKQLEDAGLTVHLIKPRHCQHVGQILGCSTTNFEVKGDFVYLGDGLFHPKALVMRNKKTVYAFDPKTKNQSIVDVASIEPILKRLKASFTRFLMAKNVGVLITLKQGQQKEFLAKTLEKDYPDKNFYFFVDNTYDFQSLSNFPFIEVFLNTMCERIGLDDANVQDIPILNVEDLYDMQNGVFD